jgi:5-methylcytosine-specific restriction protein B
MPPNPRIITELRKSDHGIVEGIDLAELLETINSRIEKLLDRDHKIGHSYFLNIESLDDLKAVFFNKIIPLLQEYFYGDTAKIGLVLGSGFIEKAPYESVKFADFGDYEDINGYMERDIYHFKDITANKSNFLNAINKLLNKSNINNDEFN